MTQLTTPIPAEQQRAAVEYETSRGGWLHSFPVLSHPDYECWVGTVSSTEEAGCLGTALADAGFKVYLGRSEKTEVAAAVCLRWSVFVDGDRETVAAAREIAADLIRQFVQIAMARRGN